MKNILRFVIILFLVNLVAASILAGVYSITKFRIERQDVKAREDALRQVMPEGVGGRLEAIKEDGDIEYWKVFKGSRLSGYIFIAEKYGYSSVIETMVGMKKDGTITGLKVLSQNETPGLGAKIIEAASTKTLDNALKGIFSKEKKVEKEILPYFTEQFKGMDIRTIRLSKDRIHAITGATISSKAVVDSIKREGIRILNAK